MFQNFFLTRCQILIPIILAPWEAEIRKILVQSSHADRSQDPTSKITIAKWTGGVTQVVENLLFQVPACSARSNS
jgi:hypothetical protein